MHEIVSGRQQSVRELNEEFDGLMHDTAKLLLVDPARFPRIAQFVSLFRPISVVVKANEKIIAANKIRHSLKERLGKI